MYDKLAFSDDPLFSDFTRASRFQLFFWNLRPEYVTTRKSAMKENDPQIDLGEFSTD